MHDVDVYVPKKGGVEEGGGDNEEKREDRGTPSKKAYSALVAKDSRNQTETCPSTHRS